MYMYKFSFSGACARIKLLAEHDLARFFLKDMEQACRYITMRVPCPRDTLGVHTVDLKLHELVLFSGDRFPPR